jgi:hypothetical protein
MTNTPENRTNILAALQVKAESENKESVRDCLRLYREGQDTRQLTRAFNGVNKDILVLTMEFLQVPGEAIYNKPTVADHLITRIKNLLPSKCNHCTKDYVVDVDDKPLLSCAVCGRETHTECVTDLLGVTDDDEIAALNPEEVRKKINPLDVPGVHYMCGQCTDLYVSSPDSGKLHKAPDAAIATVSAPKKTIKPKKRNQNVSFAANDEANDEGNDELSDDSDDESNKESCSSSEHDDSTASEESDDEEGKTKKQKRDCHHTKCTCDGRSKGIKPKKKTEQTKPICSFYRKGTCRYGISGKGCPKSHPAPCRKLLTHGTHNVRGCKKGKGCEKFHPKMCISSMNHGECLLETCRLRHVRGTKRHFTPKTDFKRDQHKHQKTNNTSDFLGVLEALKAELMEAMDTKFQSLQKLQTLPVTGIGLQHQMPQQQMPMYPPYMMRYQGQPPHHH